MSAKASPDRPLRLLERLLFAALLVLIVAVALLVDQVTGNHVNVCRWLNSTHGLCS